MKDQDKTKGELINELVESRQRIAELEALETELRQVEEELSVAYDTLHSTVGGVIITDLEGKIRYVNPAFLRMFEYEDRDAVIGKRAAKLFPPERVQKFSDVQAIIDQVKGETEEFLARRKDGTIFPVEVSSSTVTDQEGNDVGRMASFVDISERKRAEEELRKVNRALRALSKCNQAVIRATDEPHLLHEICRIIVKAVGYRLAWVGFAEQDEKKTVRPVAQAGYEEGYLGTVNITWADTERGHGPTGTAIRTGNPSIAKNILTDPDFAPWRAEATRRGYASSIALPLIGNGRTFGALNIYAEEPDAFDAEEVKLLTELADDLAFGIVALRTRAERKQAEEALRESEERYRDLIESTYDIIQSIAPDGRFVFVNRAWLETLGYTEAELPSLDLWKIIHPESLLRCRKTFSRVMAGDSIESVQATFVAKDGRAILVEGNVTGRYIGGRLVATHGFFRDITERKRAEEELQHTLEKLREALGGIIQTVALTIEAKDPYTAGHQRHVGNLARAIATEMGLSKDQIEGIRMTGLIHDLGKIGVPAEILSRPGRLSDLQFGLIKAHSQIGYDILGTIEFPWPVAQIVLQHHERLDGSGYPQGLSGEEIMVEARILAVADVVEAMASYRPYRAALGIDKALEEISQNKGVLYDPEVVDACLKLFTEKGFEFE